MLVVQQRKLKEKDDFMNILHITAVHLQKIGGIPNVLVNLTEEQNKIEGVSSIVLSVKHNVDEIDSHWFIFKF